MKVRTLAVVLAIAATGLVGCGKKTPETNGNATGAAPSQQTQPAAPETQPAPAAPAPSQAQPAQPEAQPSAAPAAQEQKQEEKKDNTQEPPR